MGAEIDGGDGPVDRADLALAEGVDRGRDLAALARRPGSGWMKPAARAVVGRTFCQTPSALVTPPADAELGRRAGRGRPSNSAPRIGSNSRAHFSPRRRQAPAPLDVGGQGLAELGGQPVRVGDDDERELVEARLELVLGQDVDGVMEVEQGVERAFEVLEDVAPGREDGVGPVPEALARQEQGDLGHARRLVAHGLAGPAESGDRLFLGDDGLDDVSGARGRVIDLEAAALHQDDGRLLHQVLGRLDRPGRGPGPCRSPRP